jgi:AraC-like DNA-binding protein
MNNKEISEYANNDAATMSPMILFTSFNINESKVRVWGENVDTNFEKLFDAIHLIAKIDGIVSGRKLIKHKKSKRINIWQDKLDLADLDRLFITKLKNVIEDNYQYSVFGKTHMASCLAVCERHLNRKVKKLIGANPIDLLRDYRLMKSARILRQGIQVGIVSDLCGFNSNSYFSSCFKKKFGMSPKNYQIERLLQKRKN